MSQDNDLRIEIGIETDSSIQTASDELDDVADSLDAIESEMAQIKRSKALNDIAKSASKLANETDDAKNATRQLANELDKVGASDKEIAGVVKQYERLTNEINQASSAQDRFDATSKDVALAGDVQSNLGAVSGLAGAAGAGGISQGISGAGEVVALVEELPRLKESVKGLPGALSSAASALGPAGLLVVGVAAGAAALVAIYKFSIKEQEDALKSFAAASAEFVDFAAGGGTTEDAKTRIDEELRLIEFANAEKLRLEESYQLNSFNALDTLVNSGEQAIKDQIKEFDAQIGDSEANIKRYGEAITNQSLATNDSIIAAEEAAVAERDLATARSATALSTAKSAADSLALEQDAADFTVEQLASRRKQIEEQRAQQQVELDSLKASGDESEAVSARIDALTSSIAGLGDDLTFLDSTQAKSAASANDAAKAQESLAKEEKKLAQSATSAAASIESVANSFSTLDPSGTRRTRHTSGPRVSRARIGKRTSSAVREAASAIESEMTDAFRSAGEDRLNIIKEFNLRETELKRDAIFAQEQDLERFRFDQDQLLAKGSFTAAFQSTVEKNFQQGQDRAQLQFDANTRQNDLTSQLAELSQALQQQTVQLQIEPSRQFDVRVVGGTANVINGIGSF